MKLDFVPNGNVFGMKSSLLILTLTGTHVGSRRLSIYNDINGGSGIETPEAWIPTIKKHNSRSTTKRTYECDEDRNAPIAANQCATNTDT